MVEMVGVSWVQIKDEIVAACGKGIEKDSMLEDFAKIGELMTNSKVCLKHLGELNDKLFKKGKADQTIRTNLFMVEARSFGRSKFVLKESDDPRYAGKEGFTVVKHHKLLTSVLDDHEAAAGFNTGRIPVGIEADAPEPDDDILPKGTPTLSRIVSPGDFRKYLFHYCYHWKDTGVGVSHGEFTHRLQWYIILEHAKTRLLRYTPLELFAACARGRWRFAKDPIKGVWDLIVDRNDSAERTFRSPEYFHTFLNSAADKRHEDHSRIWLLAQLIRGRTHKRAIEGEARTAAKQPTGEIDVPQDADRRGEMYVKVEKPDGSSGWQKTEGSIFWKARA